MLSSLRTSSGLNWLVNCPNPKLHCSQFLDNQRLWIDITENSVFSLCSHFSEYITKIELEQFQITTLETGKVKFWVQMNPKPTLLVHFLIKKTPRNPKIGIFDPIRNELMDERYENNIYEISFYDRRKCLWMIGCLWLLKSSNTLFRLVAILCNGQSITFYRMSIF